LEYLIKCGIKPELNILVVKAKNVGKVIPKTITTSTRVVRIPSSLDAA